MALRLVFALLIMVFSPTSAFCAELPVYDFSMKNYPQNVDSFFPAKAQDSNRPLVSKAYQLSQLEAFYRHYFSSAPDGLSPWSAVFVEKMAPLAYPIQLKNLDYFDNKNKADDALQYQENFKLTTQNNFEKVKNNMQVESLAGWTFKPEQRAIATRNTYGRALPESAPAFHHFTFPGQGFPFDNLQESAIYVGTPLYVFIESKDKVWSLVLTPEGYFAWIKSLDLAYTSPHFIETWQKAAKTGLMAITQTETPLLDKHQHLLENTYIGSVFPRGKAPHSLLFPKKNSEQQAEIVEAFAKPEALATMPLTATKKNFELLLKQLQNRPYGWGGSFFYNDCSQELKSLFAPFGIWLPRNSVRQGEMLPQLDLSADTVEQRLETLKTKGVPLMTLIYVGNHVQLYIGEFNKLPWVYQDVWGLASEAKDKRYVIGGSVFMPLLKIYPDNPDAHSQADKSVFKIIFLNKLVANQGP